MTEANPASATQRTTVSYSWAIAFLKHIALWKDCLIEVSAVVFNVRRKKHAWNIHFSVPQ
jgi:hypothetical protein